MGELYDKVNIPGYLHKYQVSYLSLLMGLLNGLNGSVTNG
jgi:hypothetical protein